MNNLKPFGEVKPNVKPFGDKEPNVKPFGDDKMTNKFIYIDYKYKTIK